jgi:hypothetical protein
MLDNSVTKDFDKIFDLFLQKIVSVENFAFTRFSDGEMFILQNQPVVLADNYFVTGQTIGRNRYTAEEQKQFIPEHHQFYRQKLIEAFQHKQKNYYKGICPREDVGEENFQFQLSLHGEGDDEHLTYASALINKNYRRFVEEMVPLFSNRDIIYVANEMANLDGLPFKVKKHFPIGSNCPVNNYDTVEKVRSYIRDNKLADNIVLNSAASLSNYITHECFKENPNNTFLDVGSCLNPYLSLEGWKYTRGYLTHYWLNSGSPYGSLGGTW